MMKFMFAFRNFAYTPQECCLFLALYFALSVFPIYIFLVNASMIYTGNMKRLNGFLAGLREFGEN